MAGVDLARLRAGSYTCLKTLFTVHKTSHLTLIRTSSSGSPRGSFLTSQAFSHSSALITCIFVTNLTFSIGSSIISPQTIITRIFYTSLPLIPHIPWKTLIFTKIATRVQTRRANQAIFYSTFITSLFFRIPSLTFFALRC